MHSYSLIGALCREDADEFFASTSVPTKQETLHSTGHASAKIIRMLQFHNCPPVATFEKGNALPKTGSHNHGIDSPRQQIHKLSL